MSTHPTAFGPVELREMRGLTELGASETLQWAVWGQDVLAESRDLLLAVQYAGGLVGGAFGPGGEMAGMIFSFPTRDPARQHSHRLAVLPAWRGQGLGAALKWFQRDWCLARGITQVEWTVDPLRMPNAELNAGTLGASARTYYLDFYGAMQGIDAGLPSDRLLMEWHLASPRVCGLAESRALPSGPLHPPGALPAGDPLGPGDGVPANRVLDGRPLDARLDLTAPRIRLSIPPDFSALTARDPALGLEWRLHARQLFQAYFGRGYRLCGFTRRDGPAYLLERSTP